jgi:beta-alanine degradation protein BauB
MAIGETQVDDGVVRVTRWTIQPNDAIEMHAHEHDYVVVPVFDGVMYALDTHGGELAIELRQGVSYARTRGAEHRVENRGESVISFVEIELL